MSDEMNVVETPKKKVNQRRLHKDVFLIVNREDLSDNSLCFDQKELMNHLLDPQWTAKYFPIVIDTDKLYYQCN